MGNLINSSINEFTVYADKLEDEGIEVSLLRLLTTYNYLSLFFGYAYGWDFEYHIDECEGSPCSCPDQYLEPNNCGTQYFPYRNNFNIVVAWGDSYQRFAESGDGSEFTWAGDGDSSIHHYGYDQEYAPYYNNINTFFVEMA